ncbi:MAG: hypothetical protein NZ518_02910 [Dehalococcoidia bacterium]|nr:hypothetical protein [Dehalococcoidia bacterium]
MFGWFRRRPPAMPKHEVLRDAAPAERQRYRAMDFALITGRIERFSVAAVDAAMKGVREARATRPTLAVDHPLVTQLVDHSAMAIANFVTHQLWDPTIRGQWLERAYDLQVERWRALDRSTTDPFERGVIHRAIESLNQRRARAQSSNAEDDR